MWGCKCFYWNKISTDLQPQPETFSLPAPIPQWPEGQGFASGRIRLGEIEVCEVRKFLFIWGSGSSQDQKRGVNFYKPTGIQEGFFCLGHYCHYNEKPLWGYVLVAREVVAHERDCNDRSPALSCPVDYILIWTSEDGTENLEGSAYFWLPQPVEGYKSVGFVVTNTPGKPALDEVRCVRADLTDHCEAYCSILSTQSKFSRIPFAVWSTRPSHRGMHGEGVAVGTFFCGTNWSSGEELNIVCLKNLDSTRHAMPNLNQIHALIGHYGPTMFLHPDEVYFPSSVSWFFENGALMYTRGQSVGQEIDSAGSILPAGGINDGDFWLDFPNDERRDQVKLGNLRSAKLYIHVKPSLGGTFTDIVFWVFCPFNGPATLKIGYMNIALGKLGQHVGDWEHFTLRISNFTGELWSMYFSQHSGGQWVDACDLEFIQGNKAIVYSSKSGHANFPRAGSYLQGSSKLGIGLRNDAACSDHFIESSMRYEIIAAEFLGDGVINEPCWLQFMREWGPTVIYNSRTELDRILKLLPVVLRYSMESVFNRLPLELYGEEGPTGPKEKNNWFCDERC